ncbi:MAG TPA: phage holin family protein, partial [Kurthia sp.]
MKQQTPKQMTEYLNRYIVGQMNAKKSVAVDNKILNIIKTIIVIILGRVSMLLGGFDLMLSTMVGFMFTDYILGVYAAKVNNEV